MQTFVVEAVGTFQSTPSRGGRHDILHNHADQIKVSIHALTRRATLIPAVYFLLQICFNPRPHAEGDITQAEVANQYNWFQSTPSRGGRP